MEKLKVSKSTKIHSLAGAIAYKVRKNEAVDITVVGNQALYQAMKAIIMARKFLQNDKSSFDIDIKPEYTIEHFESDSLDYPHDVTAIVLHISKCEIDDKNIITNINPTN